MTLSTYASGTQTAVINTEHFLSSPNAVGKFHLYLDLSNMAAGDILEVRAYKMTIASGTSRAMWYQAYYGAQPAQNLIALSTLIPNTLTDANAVRFSIKQTFGTGRNYDWLVVDEDDGANVTKWLGTAAATPATAGIPEVDVKNINNVAQTARDIGASVLLSPGTGAGQLDLTAGVVKANIVSTLGTALAAVAGYVGLDWSHINAPTTVVDLTGTKINTLDNAAPDSTAVTEIGADVDELIVSVAAIPTNPLLTSDGRLNDLDATISSRLAASSYTAPDNSSISAIHADTGTIITNQSTINSNILAIPAAVWDYVSRTLTSGSSPTVQQIVNGVLDEDNRNHEQANSVGLNIFNAGGAASPATIAAAVWNYTLSTPSKAGDMLLALYRRMLDAGAIVFQNPVDATQTKVRIQAGATYYASEGRQLPFTAPAGVDLTNASVVYFATVNGNEEMPINGVLVDSGHYYFELPLDANGIPLTTQFTEGPFVVIITLANNHTLWGAWGDQIVKRIRH